MRELNIHSYAKVNLFLEVLGKRDDGYHQIETVLQEIDLHDTLHFEEGEKGIEISASHPQLPSGEDNLVYRAAQLLQQKLGLSRGVKIRIEKKIPLASGLGGGSSNAAATLRGLLRLWEVQVREETLLEWGALLGMDVPFFLKGGTVLATGRGEILTPIDSHCKFWMVLVNPGFRIASAWAYGRLSLSLTERDKSAKILNCLRLGDVRGVGKCLYNRMEEVVNREYPEIARIKGELLHFGALGAVMSGSGPTVVGIVTKKSEALRIGRQFSRYKEGVYVTSTRWEREEGIADNCHRGNL